MIQASTGLRNKLLDTSAFRTLFNLGFLKLYAGPLPASADAALVGGTHTLLDTITNNDSGTGLTFAASAAGGAITKTVAEVWKGTAGATGTASFYRLVAVGDTGALSTTEARVQGTIGTSAADLDMTTVSLVSGTPYTIDAFSMGLPTL